MKRNKCSRSKLKSKKPEDDITDIDNTKRYKNKTCKTCNTIELQELKQEDASRVNKEQKSLFFYFLPNEIIKEIFSYLTVRDQLYLILTSKDIMKRLIDFVTFFKSRTYDIEDIYKSFIYDKFTNVRISKYNMPILTFLPKSIKSVKINLNKQNIVFIAENDLNQQIKKIKTYDLLTSILGQKESCSDEELNQNDCSDKQSNKEFDSVNKIKLLKVFFKSFEDKKFLCIPQTIEEIFIENCIHNEEYNPLLNLDLKKFHNLKSIRLCVKRTKTLKNAIKDINSLETLHICSYDNSFKDVLSVPSLSEDTNRNIKDKFSQKIKQKSKDIKSRPETNVTKLNTGVFETKRSNFSIDCNVNYHGIKHLVIEKRRSPINALELPKTIRRLELYFRGRSEIYNLDSLVNLEYLFISKLDFGLKYPQSLKEIVIIRLDNTSFNLTDFPFPNSLEKLTIESFEENFSPGVIPKGLKKIKLGIYINEPFNLSVLPEGLKKFKIISFIKTFTGNLPNSLEYIHLKDFKSNRIVLPNSLKKAFIEDFYGTIEKNSFPYGLRELEFKYFTGYFLEGSLPDTIEKITIEYFSYFQERDANIIVPKNLKVFKILNVNFHLSPVFSIDFSNCESLEVVIFKSNVLYENTLKLPKEKTIKELHLGKVSSIPDSFFSGYNIERIYVNNQLIKS